MKSKIILPAKLILALFAAANTCLATIPTGWNLPAFTLDLF